MILVVHPERGRGVERRMIPSMASHFAGFPVRIALQQVVLLGRHGPLLPHGNYL